MNCSLPIERDFPLIMVLRQRGWPRPVPLQRCLSVQVYHFEKGLERKFSAFGLRSGTSHVPRASVWGFDVFVGGFNKALQISLGQASLGRFFGSARSGQLSLSVQPSSVPFPTFVRFSPPPLIFNYVGFCLGFVGDVSLSARSFSNCL